MQGYEFACGTDGHQDNWMKRGGGMAETRTGRGRHAVVHFAGTRDTVTIEGPWVGNLLRGGRVEDFVAFPGGPLINMENVTYVEEVSDE
nr:hypothetical protein [uncultured Olsenella sp.]